MTWGLSPAVSLLGKTNLIRSAKRSTNRDFRLEGMSKEGSRRRERRHEQCHNGHGQEDEEQEAGDAGEEGAGEEEEEEEGDGEEERGPDDVAEDEMDDQGDDDMEGEEPGDEEGSGNCAPQIMRECAQMCAFLQCLPCVCCPALHLPVRHAAIVPRPAAAVKHPWLPDLQSVCSHACICGY